MLNFSVKANTSIHSLGEDDTAELKPAAGKTTNNTVTEQSWNLTACKRRTDSVTEQSWNRIACKTTIDTVTEHSWDPAEIQLSRHKT